MLGVRCCAITIPELMSYFEWAINSDQKNLIVSHHNLNSVYHHARVADLRRYYAMSDITYFDGMPLIYWGWILGMPIKTCHRTPYLDWNETFFAKAEAKGWRVYYLGGRQPTIDKAAKMLRDRHPELNIRFHNGFVADQDLPALYEEIQSFQPNVLLVGMGVPRQERWILKALDHVRFNIVVNGGAMVEYMVGEQALPPRWLGPIGLEWAYRLITQPRMWPRHFIQPFYILNLFWRDVVRLVGQKLS
jgi:N-acetylglucosaminyldiphosphoundecaprenol N-acetyl-beta-D-mannosaminyltransferase